nr:unnamed protein product [Callosobruchus chinensis]
MILLALVNSYQCFLFADVGCHGRISDGGDGAFGLHNNLMKPYPGAHPEGTKERNFNKKLSSARVVVETVFGIMSSVFRVLRKPLLLEPVPAI